MPFLTEELWQRLATDRATRPVSISLAPYPQYRKELTDYEAEHEIELLQKVVTSIRTDRASNGIGNKQQLQVKLWVRPAYVALVRKSCRAIQSLSNTVLEIVEGAAPREAPGSGGAELSGGMVRYRHSEPEVDFEYSVPVALSEAKQEAQRARVARETEQLRKNIASLERQLSDDKFLAKAPPPVVEGMRRKLDEYQAQLRKYD